MDWDVRGMHMHLLMLSIQEEPPGTIPADDAAIRRWLSLPLGSVDSDQTWRRVKSQLLAAWQPEGERLVNRGMLETCQRRERYAGRYENGTKTVRKNTENHCNRSIDLVLDTSIKENPKPKKKQAQTIPPSLEEVTAYCKERGNQVDPAKWFDSYQSKGWYVGKNKMRDWKAAVRTWEHNGYGGPFQDGHQKSAAQLRNERSAAAIDRAFAEDQSSEDLPSGIR